MRHPFIHSSITSTSPFKGSNTEFCTNTFTDYSALLLLFLRSYNIHNGHNHIGDIGGAVLSKAKHSIIRLSAELGPYNL